jgi:hypothetical protein
VGYIETKTPGPENLDSDADKIGLRNSLRNKAQAITDKEIIFDESPLEALREMEINRERKRKELEPLAENEVSKLPFRCKASN